MLNTNGVHSQSYNVLRWASREQTTQSFMSAVQPANKSAYHAFLQVKAVGKDRLVLDLSCKKHDGAYHVATDRWQKISSLAVNEQSLGKLGRSCGEFLVHGVDVEGKQSGIDEELVKLLAEQSPVPVTYAGGVSSMVSFTMAVL